MTCRYKFSNGNRCVELVWQNSEFCILHIDLPEDEESDEFREINELKNQKVEEKVSKEDFNFEGARLLEVDFSRKNITKIQCRPMDGPMGGFMFPVEIKSNLNFTNAVIRRDALFNEAEINGMASFDGAKIGGNASFVRVKINGDASLDGAKIGEYAKFNESEIGGSARFRGAKIAEDATFDEAKISGIVSFQDAAIDGIVSLAGADINGIASFERANIGKDVSFVKTKIVADAWFPEAKIVGDVAFQEAKIDRDVSFNGAKISGRTISFDRTEIKGKLSFKDTTFKNPEAQEEACRTAKNIWKCLGDRGEEDYYYYREMEAKRKQKSPIIRFLELILIQYPFGYGTKMKPAFIIFLLIVLASALSFWIGNGVYQLVAYLLAIIAAIIGTLFITIFARKYMR